MRFEKLTVCDDKIVINSLYAPFPSGSYRSALKGFKRLAQGEIVPISTYISLTDRCNLDCCYCSNIKDESKEELMKLDVIAFINEVQDAGASCIRFTGGACYEMI